MLVVMMFKFHISRPVLLEPLSDFLLRDPCFLPLLSPASLDLCFNHSCIYCSGKASSATYSNGRNVYVHTHTSVTCLINKDRDTQKHQKQHTQTQPLIL